MGKSYRIRTEVGVDKYINVNLEQDWESLEVLSLKILANDVYTRFCADYGVVTGRVFVNGGFGLPNAKVSVFIPLEAADELDPVISELYPYKTITETNEDGYRYNLLPKLPSYNGHVSTGSFPNKGDILMDGSYIEVYDKYYRFTVTTNESGDFMIFGVPVGTQTIVMDVDLSDIGCFSLSPQDLIQQGLATETQVNGAKFKSSTNLRELPQIKNLVFDVDVRPFWGDADLCQVGITRVDFDLTKQANINIQPTAIFMGSIISTTDDDALKVSCKPKNNTGNLCELVAGPGEIQAIRQTIFSDDNGLPILERYEIEQEGKVIDADGTYLLNVPMNLDYVFTNEFGQQVISNDPKKGIPTKGKYRFRFKWQNEQGLQGSFQRANFLVPNIKEYGWNNTYNSSNDPFTNLSPGTYNYSISAGLVTGTTIINNLGYNLGLSQPVTNNVSSYSIYLNGQLYFGSLNSIPFDFGDTIQIVGTPIDSSQPQSFSFTSYQEELFNLLRSYAFSTDWDDYANVQEALNCEDTFYEFGYNKVYTTTMFLDRYKKGIGRAKHLGIKEIDNRSCKSTVNTFPVNDIIRNFDTIFFVFNILINILTFPILVLLFVAHFISFLWPILKYVLIILGIVLTRQAIDDAQEVFENASEIIEAQLSAINVSLAGPVVDTGALAKAVRLLIKQFILIAKAVFSAVLAATFTAFAIFAAVKIKGFPRIGLPMISYPDCTSCDCDCKNADMSDDFDSNSVYNEINTAAQSSGGGSNNTQLSTPKTLIAPVNSSGAYTLDHPNLNNDPNGNDPFPPCKSFTTLLEATSQDEISVDVVVKASLDYIRIASGSDVISSTDPNRYLPNEAYLLKAPQPFLFSAEKNAGADDRFFAYPTSVTFSQKLNEFNTRDKYFKSSTISAFGTGVNRIKTTVNPTSGSTPYEDQVIVVLMTAGSTESLGVGNIITLQDPNYMDSGSTLRMVNLTGATINQFQNNSITGTTFTGQTSLPLTYADPSNPSNGLTANIVINSPQVSQLPVVGNPNVEQSYLQYPTDLEYFQLITGITYTDFINQSNYTSASGFYPQTYLLHDISYIAPCGGSNTLSNIIGVMENYQTYEICIFVRGVDPFTTKQTISYDLSKIFGKSYGNITIQGDYYLNVPIQPLNTLLKPTTHNTTNNNNQTLYFPSFTFTPDPIQYTAFTSNLPYYYLSTDDILSTTYSPYPGQWQTNNLSTTSLQQTIANGYGLPIPSTSYYTVGGTYLRWVNDFQFTNLNMQTGNNNSNPPCNQDCQKGEYFNTGSTFYTGVNSMGNLSALYSPAYYRYGLNPISFPTTYSNRIVMRSDRLPTSTNVQNGPSGTQTGYGLHQNDNFSFYGQNGNETQPTIGVGGDLISGESQDDDPITTGLTETLTCEGMVPLECYSGSGNNVGVLPAGQCAIPSNRMVNGCYCLLNYIETGIPVFKKLYLIPEYFRDAKLFLEWKTRFTMNFAACRGVFGQVFQNNWINGVLYMFNFNKRTTFGVNATNPNYNYCENVIVFNELSNNFYYRSSPWNNTIQEFIGKDSPNYNSQSSFSNFPGFGYNVKQIQFPTTVVDLGPRDYFINEVCCSGGIDGFGSYYGNQLKATSYQDNSDIIQLGFLSRILNDGVRQRMIPISSGDNSTEGQGIIQFFNSTRGGYRIDGDWAQMLSINSEWKVLPFISENVPSNQYIFFGDNGAPTPDQIKPVMGLFFQTPQENLKYRKIESPGIETYNFTPLIEEKFGYSKSQVVPHYKWSLKKSSPSQNIFGTEDNNWYTNVIGQGFFKKKYQDLDFTTLGEKYITSTTKLGYITNYTLAGVPEPLIPPSIVNQGIPSGNANQSVVVGAPYHFYFGLNNGKTAVDRFYKLYVATAEE